jgi:hypothetical protein
MMRLGASSAVRLTCSLSNRPEAAPQAAVGCHHSPSSLEPGRGGESAAFGSRKEVVPAPRDQQPFWPGERVLVSRQHALSVRMLRRPHGLHSTNFDKAGNDLPAADSFFSSNLTTASSLAARGWMDRSLACPPPCLDHTGAPAGSLDPGLRGPRRNRSATASLAAAQACRLPSPWHAGGQTFPDVSHRPPIDIPGFEHTDVRALSRATRPACTGTARVGAAATAGACPAHTSADAVYATIFRIITGARRGDHWQRGYRSTPRRHGAPRPPALLYSPFLQAKCSAKHLGQASTAPDSPATCMQLPASCC